MGKSRSSWTAGHQVSNTELFIELKITQTHFMKKSIIIKTITIYNKNNNKLSDKFDNCLISIIQTLLMDLYHFKLFLVKKTTSIKKIEMDTLIAFASLFKIKKNIAETNFEMKNLANSKSM